MVRKEYVVDEVQKMMYDPKYIRNVAIVAHVDHGKSTLGDSLVARAGLMNKELAGQQRVLDYDEIEQARGITIKAAYISLGFQYGGKDYLINLIDTPGHVDFGGHVTRAMRAVDGIILVVDAVEGIMPQTETVLRQAMKEKAKPTVFVNKIDRLINELKLTPEQMQDRLMKIIFGINKLITQYGPSDKAEEWLIKVDKGNVAFGSAYNRWAISFPIMQKNKITFKDIYRYCADQNHAHLVEIAPVDDVVLEMVIKHLPTPDTAQPYRIPVIWKGDITSESGKGMVNCDPKGKAVLVVFGVATDPHAGEVGICRVFSGTPKKGVEVLVHGKHKREKIQQVSVYMGPDRVIVEEIPAGNIAAVVGVHDLYVGETLSEDNDLDPFEEIKHYSEPVLTKSVEAKSVKDLVKLMQVLRDVAKEDPTIKIEINPETGEHLISGMGELHLEIVEEKIKRDNKLEVTTSRPIVVYKETITGSAGPVEGKSPNKHTKFKVVIEPVEEGVMAKMIEGDIPDGRPKGKALWDVLIDAGMERDEAKSVKDIFNRNMLIDATKGVQYLNEVMELLVEGFELACKQGPLAKEKVSGVKVRIVDATIHEDPVHRGPAQIIPAIRRAVYAGILLAGDVLLEPKQKFTIQAPAQYMGELIKQVQGRRGQMLDIQQNETGEVVTLLAKIPVAETFGLANDFRSATQGRAIWYPEFAGYEKLTPELQNKIVPEIRERKGEKKEIPQPIDFLD